MGKKHITIRLDDSLLELVMQLEKSKNRTTAIEKRLIKSLFL